MGMFDFVRVPESLHKCPKCQGPLDGWQSKDRACEMRTLEWWEVDQFYDFCETCEELIVYKWCRAWDRKATPPISDEFVRVYFEEPDTDGEVTQ